MRYNRYLTKDHAYAYTLEQLVVDPDHVASPRGQEVREVRDMAFEVDAPSPGPVVTADPARNAVIAAYTAKEMALYESCENRASEFAKASRFWEGLANPDGTVNSAYGRLIWRDPSLPDGLTPWEWAVKSLRHDKDSRQAYVRFSRPDHQWHGNKDQVCTMHMNFLIRSERLYGSVVMRSCDVVKGLAYDMPFFISLMWRMRDELDSRYPGLLLGSYTHFAHSMHLYMRDLAVARAMLGLERMAA